MRVNYLTFCSVLVDGKRQIMLVPRVIILRTSIYDERALREDSNIHDQKFLEGSKLCNLMDARINSSQGL